MGCWRNGTRCRVSQVSSIDAATVITTDDRFPDNSARRDRWRKLSDSAAVARTWGDGYGYMMVATGRAEAMVDSVVSDWDAACMQPIVVEAGGVLTDFAGEHTPFNGSLIATNAALADAVRGTLRDG
jgi:fructose-1,6-bisphosphatase/inositol monophosphatase family enzyme